jgi:hypothetical protein
MRELVRSLGSLAFWLENTTHILPAGSKSLVEKLLTLIPEVERPRFELF